VGFLLIGVMKEFFKPIHLKHELVRHDKKLKVIIKKMDEMALNSENG
jgi:hypothetical protein